MKEFTLREVKLTTSAYFKGDELATDTWINKYALKDKDGNIYERSPDDMHKRLARELARIEQNYPNPLNEDQIYKLLKDFKYIVPQGSPMFGIGNDFQLTSISNCFFIGSNNDSDSYGSIMRTDEEIAQVYKRRGGCGIDLSHYRPSGAIASGSKLKGDAGATLYMERFSNTTREVAQCLGGETYILTNTGLKYIKDIGIGDKVWTKDGWVNVVNVLKNKKNVNLVKTKFGREILCSKDHVFHTIDGELPVENIKNNITAILGEGWNGRDVKLKYVDYIKSSINNSNRLNENVNLPSSINEDFSYFLGYFYANGYADKDYLSISIPSHIPELFDKILKLTNTLFNINPYVIDNKTWKVINISSKLLIHHLRENNILKQKSTELELPSFLDYCKEEILFSFISGYFDADGTIIKSKKTYRISSASHSVVSKFQILLSSFGIISRIHKLDRSEIENWHDIYNISITSKEAQYKLYTLLRQSVKINSIERFDKKTDKVRTTYKISDFNSKAGRHNYIMNNDQFISYSTAFRLLNDLNIDKKINLIQDSIVDIQQIDGECDVYDLTLDREHLFFANGLYTHNSGRRGALMQSISIKHPDAEKFIDKKNNLNKVTGANISVKVTDEFMEAVKNDSDYIQTFPINLDINNHTVFIESLHNNSIEYDKLYDLSYNNCLEYKGCYAKRIKAKKLWDKLIINNHKSAEPGILFWDKFVSESPSEGYNSHEIKGLNPCGEICLPDFDSCRLMVINLYSYITYPFTDKAKFDWGLFKSHIIIVQRLMDDLVDLEIEKVEKIINKIKLDSETKSIKQVELNLWKKIKQKAIEGRRTGVGITAEGDMLAALGLRYGSEAATDFSVEVHKTIAIESYASSIIMAKERGTFPIWEFEREKNNPFINRIKKWFKEYSYSYSQFGAFSKAIEKIGRRNIALLTIAPTGTTSLMTQTSSGIEPVFLPIYKRRKKTDDKDKAVFIDEIGDMWEEYNVFHHKFIEWFSIESHLNNYKEAKFALENTSEDCLNKLIKESPYYQATSADVNWKEAVRMQGEIQKWVDHSISKTINLPENTPVEVIDELYRYAHEVGCKGVTVYREGSRSGVLISNNKEVSYKEIDYKEAPKRPKELPVDIYHKIALGKHWTIIVGLLKGRPFEIFAFEQLEQQDFPKEISKAVLCRVTKKHYKLIGQRNNKEYIVDNIIPLMESDEQYQTRDFSRDLRHGIKPKHIVSDIDKSSYISSFRKVISRVLKNYLLNEDVAENCPDCKDKLIYQDGCKLCKSCGWTACG